MSDWYRFGQDVHPSLEKKKKTLSIENCFPHISRERTREKNFSWTVKKNENWNFWEKFFFSTWSINIVKWYRWSHFTLSYKRNCISKKNFISCFSGLHPFTIATLTFSYSLSLLNLYRPNFVRMWGIFSSPIQFSTCVFICLYFSFSLIHFHPLNIPNNQQLKLRCIKRDKRKFCFENGSKIYIFTPRRQRILEGCPCLL